MVANTAADALARFLNATPDVAPNTAGPGELIDRLGRALLPAGEQGLPLAEAMVSSNLQRADFLNALSAAIGAGLVETVDNAGVQTLRLTVSGRSLY